MDTGRAKTQKPRITGRRRKGAIEHKLGLSILSGEFAPGDRLWGEVASSAVLDVSRSAYREAVQVLSSKGLVESRPRTGTRVLPRSRWNLLDPEVLAWAIAGEPDPDLTLGLLELRAIVAPAAAGLAAERRDRDDLKALKSALDGLSRHAIASDAQRAADREFHDAILRATRNDALVVLSACMSTAVAMASRLRECSGTLHHNPIPEHRKVFRAIAAGDAPSAIAAMNELVLQTQRTGRIVTDRFPDTANASSAGSNAIPAEAHVHRK